MIIISDTSPIINLAIIGYLDLIPSVKPLMDALRTKARFFIHQSLYNQVLKIAKEEP